ncbi:dethiobiotin synthase [Lacimicrobium sp. SS2-24]|uniref:dethiobiotin synthase n=1 Tax=Lacimicrobium sp. SS2-24 TaxID=2005569 RepID=UPI000B4B3906|nr:dethiobiotin synthase [Lacimicrobium sp. SS2-24]
MKSFFVTGTDTEVGKTFVTATMLHQLAYRRFQTIGFKPVASGSEETEDGLRNADALTLQAASTLALTYEQVNPFTFLPAIAPHIAAKEQGQVISLKRLTEHYHKLKQLGADYLFTEGAGGWRLPLGDDDYLSDFVKAEKIDVILVVGMRLGCLNHALLTCEAIAADGLNLAGWVANQVELDMPHIETNLESLKQRIQAPFLGYIPRLNDPESSQQYLDLTPLF